ncbi:5-methylcytosine g t mismatch-specific dna [Coniochaeta hoffmannii]|uniref:5-methylcytosine g t mismatch-specific dna n=1 Tax=Coniochaeta hoffmannii TaxID=91930 RepID=A0AA38S489_9PEZI|nr:5-methylcytosine g t mismatch-specific dna [Coniochaeta hoffmannii]
MPSQDRDVDILDDRPREKKVRSSKSDKERRDRDKDKDRDRDKLRERDKESSSSSHRHRTSRSSKLRPADSESTLHSHRRHRTSKEKERDREKDGSERSDRKEKRSSSMADLVPELARTSLDGSRERISIPYPSFSKAHSKEYVASKEDVSVPAGRGTDPLTPVATDLGSATMRRTKSADSPTSRRASPKPRKETQKDTRPLTPPETDLSTEQRNGERRKDDSSVTAKWQDDPDTPVPSRLGAERPRSRTTSWVSKSSVSRSTSTARDDKSSMSKTSSQATFVQPPRLKTPYVEPVKDNDSVVEVPPRPAGPGDAPRQRARRRPPGGMPAPAAVVVMDSASESGQDDIPQTPVQINGVPQRYMLPVEKYPPHASFEAQPSEPRSEITPSATPANGVRPGAGAAAAGPPPPPPPPPPPLLTIPEVPRVDYLMQNGGLPQPIPKNFLAVIPHLNGTRPSNPPLRGAETLFAPFFNLLNQYQTVLDGHGSVAVALGHRTVARRLLNRLEHVFSRDLSPEGCSCVMCETSGEPHRGLGWGEVLERVSGRIEIPAWPPFDLVSMTKTATEGLADMPARPASPVKMDPDIAEEFREHYLRQSKRVRKAVDNWMNNMGDSPAPLPSEVDDETLNFAILTNLDQEQRPLFNALLKGTRDVVAPVIRAPTPMGKHRRNDFVVRTGLALQRLYRLKSAPRDAETVVFLVKYPHMHDLLHTISEINPSEWEILVSGRFDGFLWSGADGDDLLTPTAEAPSRGVTPSFPSPPSRILSPSSGAQPYHHPGFGISRPGTNQSMSTFPSASRGPTPFSRGATPASFVSGVSAASSAFPGAGGRPAVSNDEEAEIAALAEVEREIFAGMEALEDAFEMLHQRAEEVRNALRQRGAGLQMSLQQRRGLFTGILGGDGEGGTGGGHWTVEGGESMASESDWGGDDQSEIAPDDSASNISSSRTRRPKRRNERRTPAPIEEEEE